MTKKKTGHGLMKFSIIAAAAAAGAYYLYGTQDGAKARKKMGSWAMKLKKEVIKETQKLEKVGQADYNKIVLRLKKKYDGVKSIDPKEMNAVVADLKKHWSVVKKQFKAGSR